MAPPKKLNPNASSFTPSYGNGNDLASWAQGLTSNGAQKQSSPFAAAAQLPAINTYKAAATRTRSFETTTAGGKPQAASKTQRPPQQASAGGGSEQNSATRPISIASAQPLPVAAHAQGLTTSASSARESWTSGYVRRAVGSDSGELAFDDLFIDGAHGSRTGSRSSTPAIGGHLEAASSLESPSAAQSSAAAALEDALATGGMIATNYVDVDAPVVQPCDGAAEDDGATPPPELPPSPQKSVLRPDTPLSPSKVSPADFQVLKVVGQGAFGKVFMVRKKDTGCIYAMKVMRKDRILAREHSEYVQAERDVLTSVRHPYIVMLHWSFQTSAKLYLVLDFINGGHLFFNLYRAGIFDEPQAKLYTAEIVDAIGHLHALDILHRDLKPENVLLDSEGHIRITDFGLAKAGMSDGERSNSLIGTMEYMAPEIINATGHDKAVDWWSVGILLYEMLCGVTPFRQKDKGRLKRMITCDKLKFTKSADGYLSKDAKSLVRALLEKNPTQRLGSGRNGTADVKAHPFFRSINWSQLEIRKVPSPYCPRTNGDECTDNFDKLWTDRTPEDSPVGTPVAGGILDGPGSSFKGFTYVAPSLLLAS